MEKMIMTIREASCTQYKKPWRVVLAFPHEKDQHYWLSIAQYEYLQSAFDRTPKGYSSNTHQVIGEFDDQKGYFIRCRCERHSKTGHHTPVVDCASPARIPDDLYDH